MGVPAEDSTAGASTEAQMELVGALFDASARDDLEGYLALLTEDAEFDFSDVERPYRGVYRGHEQIRSLYRHLDEPWREKAFELQDAVLLTGGVLVDVTRRSRTAAGLAVQTATTALITIRGERIARVKTFGARADALRAAGLAD